MSDQDALLAAIIANPDDDTPRLVYADWLDENAPDKTPSPAAGPSARAEYIRAQCRLAQFPFDEPDYPELLEREEDLAQWLQTHSHNDPARAEPPEGLEWYSDFDSGEWRKYTRGFPAVVEYTDYDDEPGVNVERILTALPEAFEHTTFRTLRLEDAYGEEVVGLMRSPIMAGLRGLLLCEIADDNSSDAVRAIAASPHLRDLTRLELEFYGGDEDLKQLAQAGLDSLQAFSLDGPSTAGWKALGEAKWFRNLRSLKVWADERDVIRALAEFPEMPNLVELVVGGSAVPTITAVRKLASSDSFPRLAHLEWLSARLTSEHVAALTRAPWPLRHLRLHRLGVRKPGAEALANAAFAESLRVLELPECEITAGGVQALAASGRLAGLRHLDLSGNPVGVGGLAALARSPHLQGLRSLSLAHSNDVKALLDAAALLKFLSALEMPELRHLKLDRLPVCVRGGRVFGVSGSFANLTRLSLTECGLREKGARAIVESLLLPNLTALDLVGNDAGKGVARLADPKVLPRLGHANLSRNRIPSSALTRLRKRPSVQV